jgi:hypothetical protein
MNLVTPNLGMATGAKIIVNSLYDSKDPGFLTQDLLLVELPGKTYIDVSWFPEHDPSGAYSVTVFRGHNQIQEAEARTACEAVKIVERFAVDFSSAHGNGSGPAEVGMQFQPAASEGEEMPATA